MYSSYALSCSASLTPSITDIYAAAAAAQYVTGRVYFVFSPVDRHGGCFSFWSSKKTLLSAFL